MRAERRMACRWWCAVLTVGVLATVPLARGQEASTAEFTQDTAPARAARLTFLEGTVTVETPQTPGTQTAEPNLPLLAGVRVLTGEDGQAEVEFEDGSVVRLTPNSTLALDALAVDASTRYKTTVSVVRGLVYAELRASKAYEYKLAAGGDVLSPVENATVRVNFDEPPAKFAVLDGVVEVSHKDGSGTQQVRAGETLQASDAAVEVYKLVAGVTDETWDAWNSDRDKAEAGESTVATGVRDGYAGSQGYGWADLDANGTWYDVPGQGQVWQPQVAVEDAGFDPYGLGAWVWYPVSGYVWASGYAWGWTPYRCGSWNHYDGFGWGWTPAAGCGAGGWRFWGTGRQVNVGYGPSGYRVPVVPRPRPGPIHPILPTRLDAGRQSVATSGQAGWGALVQRGPREIGGQIAMPVAARGSSESAAMLAGGAARTGALARDYPVDRERRAAVLGKMSMQVPLVHTEAGWQRGAERREAYTGQSGAAVFRQRQEQGVGSGLAGGATEAGAGMRAVASPAMPSGTSVSHSMQRRAYVPEAGQGSQAQGFERGPRPAYVPGVQGQAVERPRSGAPMTGQTWPRNTMPAPPPQPAMPRPYMPPPPQQPAMPRPYMPPPPPQPAAPRPYMPPPPQQPVQHAAPAPAAGQTPAGRSPR